MFHIYVFHEIIFKTDKTSQGNNNNLFILHFLITNIIYTSVRISVNDQNSTTYYALFIRRNNRSRQRKLGVLSP